MKKRWFRVQIKSARANWELYRRNRAACAGLILILINLLMALSAPFIAPYGPKQIGTESFRPPEAKHPMGTDDLGRDIFSQILWGAQISLLVSLLASISSTVIGILIGATAGYFGGRIDDILMRATELFQVLPKFLTALVLTSVLGCNIWNVIAIIGILTWPSTARLTRAEFLSIKEREFVRAAKTLGASSSTIVFSEILPNAIPPAIVNASLLVSTAIQLEAGLSFLGLGDPNVVSWGWILYNARVFYWHAWWLALFPGLAIVLMVVGFNFAGEGINEILNPKLRKIGGR